MTVSPYAAPRDATLLLPPKSERADVAGTPFDLIDEFTLDCVIDQRPAEAPFEYLVTPNVDHVVRSHRVGLRDLYDNAWASVCDSRILAKLAPLVHVHFPSVITGSDLTRRILERIVKPDDHITVVGCDVAHVNRLTAQLPGTTFHHYNPPMGFIGVPVEVDRAVEFVIAHPSRFVFLAVGSPQQEKLALRIKERNGTGLGLCVGASIHFIVGAERRAPRWMQSINLEWLFRLLQDPRRLWRRYLIDNPTIFLLVLRHRLLASRR